MLKAHQQERVPATPPVECTLNAKTVLAGKGSLRRAESRRALASSAPFRPELFRDGRLRREHFTVYLAQIILQNLTHTTSAQVSEGQLIPVIHGNTGHFTCYLNRTS